LTLKTVTQNFKLSQLATALFDSGSTTEPDYCLALGLNAAKAVRGQKQRDVEAVATELVAEMLGM
jgi:hypothetical protein